MSMGTIKPVDSFAPKANAISVTVIIVMPLIPAFANPKTKAAKKAIIQVEIEISEVMKSTTNCLL